MDGTIPLEEHWDRARVLARDDHLGAKVCPIEWTETNAGRLMKT